MWTRKLSIQLNQAHDNFCDPMALMRWSWIQ